MPDRKSDQQLTILLRECERDGIKVVLDYDPERPYYISIGGAVLDEEDDEHRDFEEVVEVRNLTQEEIERQNSQEGKDFGQAAMPFSLQRRRRGRIH